MSKPLVVTSVAEMQKVRQAMTGTIGFVPTMGALHSGHATLMQKSLAENEQTVVSIFVNPTQFNDKKDLEKYPSNFAGDLEMLQKLGVQILFAPPFLEMYPDNYNYQISEKEMSPLLCGNFREGHFNGVLTIVLKLFNIVRPTRAYFGEKDYQQYQLIKKMTEALFMNVEVVGCPLIRDENGLALSSRNKLLNGEQIRLAQKFAHVLSSEKSKQQVLEKLSDLGIETEYIEELWGRRLAAVKVGPVRLIDNVKI